MGHLAMEQVCAQSAGDLWAQGDGGGLGEVKRRTGRAMDEVRRRENERNVRLWLDYRGGLLAVLA